MKIKLYLDFDGVILNTIDVTYEMFKKNNEYDDINEFYKNLDWDYVLSISSPINDSINAIHKLVKSGLYDVHILTHFNTEKEARSKKRFDKKELDNVKLITVIKGVNKCEVVDCENAVLVDDYMGNLVLWQANGGIPIKFSDKGKKYDIMSISNLTELIDRYDEICSLVETNNKKLVNSKK